MRLLNLLISLQLILRQPPLCQCVGLQHKHMPIIPHTLLQTLILPLLHSLHHFIFTLYHLLSNM